MIPLPFIEPKAASRSTGSKLNRLQQLASRRSPDSIRSATAFSAGRRSCWPSRSDRHATRTGAPVTRRPDPQDTGFVLEVGSWELASIADRRCVVATASLALGGRRAPVRAVDRRRRAAAPRPLASARRRRRWADRDRAGDDRRVHSWSSARRWPSTGGRGRPVLLARWRCSSSASSTTGCSCRRWPSWWRRWPSARFWCSRSPGPSRMRAAHQLHAHRHDLVRRRATRSTCSTTWTAWPPAWRSSPRRSWPRCSATSRTGARRAARVAGRRAARVPVLEPSAGAAVHGRLRQPVHRRDAGGASLVPVFTRADRVRRARRAVVLILVVPLFDTAFVLVLRRLAGRKATQGRHRSRVASSGVARLLRAQRRPDSLPARPHRRPGGRDGPERPSSRCRSWRCSAS